MAVWAAGEAIVGGAPGRWSAIVTRGAGEALWAHDADVQQLSASTIKIAVLIAVFRAIDEGRLRLDETRVLQESDKVGGSGVLRELHAGVHGSGCHDAAHPCLREPGKLPEPGRAAEPARCASC